MNVAEFERFDKWLGEHLASGLSKEVAAAAALAAGGRLELTADQIERLTRKDLEIIVERTALGWAIIARERPRCGECGRTLP